MHRNLRAVLLCGGVGGARMARALAATMSHEDLTVIVNVGDDDTRYGVHVAADLDTVLYTLAGVEGPEGWGRRDDTWGVMDEMAALGVDTSFRLGDRDFALCAERTHRLAAGEPLSAVTAALAAALGVSVPVLPATDDRLRTKVQTTDGEWLDFQDYFVVRRHRDRIAALDFAGAVDAAPVPGVVDRVAGADVVVIAPSNPPLSIWPILAVPGMRAAVAAAPAVVAVSPLFGGQALKGPAASVMADLGLPPGNRGVAAAYDGVISHLVVDVGDGDDVAVLADTGLGLTAMDTRMADPASGRAFGQRFVGWLRDELRSEAA